MAGGRHPIDHKDHRLRKDFSRSTLVRLLGDWAPVPAPDVRQDFAQRLSQWVGVADAITLHAALQATGPAGARRPTPAPAADAAHLRALLQRVRADLATAVTAKAKPPAPNPLERHPPPVPDPMNDADAGFAPHRQRYLELQRQMTLRVEAVRGQVRQALEQASPALAQLAAFDAVLERMLAAREPGLMATVPLALERRFEALRTAAVADESPDGWRHTFAQALHAALRAELEQRLQPVIGMIEALDNQLETQG